MDLKKVYELIGINELAESHLKIGQAFGLSEKNAIIRAVKLVHMQTGYDFTDDIVLSTGKKNEALNFDDYGEIIIDGIKAAINADRRPTVKAIYERKKKLKEISFDQFKNIVNHLANSLKVDIDLSKRVPAYYLVGQPSYEKP